MVSIDTAFLLYRLSGWSVCLFVAAVICAKMNEQIELPVTFGVWTLVLVSSPDSPRNGDFLPGGRYAQSDSRQGNAKRCGLGTGTLTTCLFTELFFVFSIV